VVWCSPALKMGGCEYNRRKEGLASMCHVGVPSLGAQPLVTSRWRTVKAMLGFLTSPEENGVGHILRRVPQRYPASSSAATATAPR
jgi:hypothetical protein